jgi:ABC-type transporter Mla maintaining outer membrane lipid asymmetry ATPase subunit MlaF
MTTTPSQPAIRATELRKSFGDKVVLDGVDLDVAEGTIFALLGPNGAGKTITRRLTPDKARLYQQWIANRRRIDQLLARMEQVSAQAAEILLHDADVADPRPVHTPAWAR